MLDSLTTIKEEKTMSNDSADLILDSMNDPFKDIINVHTHNVDTPPKDTMTSTLDDLSTTHLEEDAIAPCMAAPFSH